MEVPLATKREHLKDVDVAVLGIPWEGFIYDDVSGDNVVSGFSGLDIFFAKMSRSGQSSRSDKEGF